MYKNSKSNTTIANYATILAKETKGSNLVYIIFLYSKYGIRWRSQDGNPPFTSNILFESIWHESNVDLQVEIGNFSVKVSISLSGDY